MGLPRKAPVIQLDCAARTPLEEWFRSLSLAQEMALRAAPGLPNQASGQQLGCSQPTVRRWRGRLARDRLAGLRPRPRPGRPRPYAEARVNALVAATLKKPEGAIPGSTRRWAIQRGVSSATVQRPAPWLPRGPGQLERRTHDYQRHGTVDWYAALQIASGQLDARFSPRHRHQEFLQFLRLRHITRPAAQQVHLILDNLGTPKHPRVAGWRKRHPRCHFHFTPTRASWMNQLEIWFGLLPQQRLARDNFHRVEELRHAITEFLSRWNDNAQPFIWAKTAEPILAKAIPKAISARDS